MFRTKDGGDVFEPWGVRIKGGKLGYLHGVVLMIGIPSHFSVIVIDIELENIFMYFNDINNNEQITTKILQ